MSNAVCQLSLVIFGIAVTTAIGCFFDGNQFCGTVAAYLALAAGLIWFNFCVVDAEAPNEGLLRALERVANITRIMFWLIVVMLAVMLLILAAFVLGGHVS